jgi:hypothetical protein
MYQNKTGKQQGKKPGKQPEKELSPPSASNGASLRYVIIEGR